MGKRTGVCFRKGKSFPRNRPSSKTSRVRRGGEEGVWWGGVSGWRNSKFEGAQGGHLKNGGGPGRGGGEEPGMSLGGQAGPPSRASGLKGHG